jgi:hypothetical protein
MADQVSAPGADRDWTVEVANRIESVVDTVRDKTTKPVTTVAHVIVFGLVAGVLGSVGFFLIVVAGVRVLDVYLPFHPLARRVWVVDAGAAAIFLGAGAFLWRKRRAKVSQERAT